MLYSKFNIPSCVNPYRTNDFLSSSLMCFHCFKALLIESRIIMDNLTLSRYFFFLLAIDRPKGPKPPDTSPYNASNLHEVFTNIPFMSALWPTLAR